MWRFESVHEQHETEYLHDALARLQADEHLLGHAQALMRAVSSQEPLIAESFSTPQDIRYHAEGPFVRDHVQLMLLALFGLIEEKWHLIDIEEFRRLKGYEGEVDELEETLKEHHEFFKLFSLLHDVGKWPTISFTSRKNSEGSKLGFHTPHAHHTDETIHERVLLRKKYLQLYQTFEREHAQFSPQEIQVMFYEKFGIDVHYPNHARKIHSRVYADLLQRLCAAHQLSKQERAMLEDLISHHMEFGSDFVHVAPKKIDRYFFLAKKRGFDGDDFLDLLQGCLFLDGVCGSQRLSDHKRWHEVHTLIYCFKSEHEYAPWKRAARQQEKEEQEKRMRNQLLKETGLDGIALMELFDMEAGPEFGRLLRRVHAALLGKADMPVFSPKINKELSARTANYYQRIFKKGE